MDTYAGCVSEFMQNGEKDIPTALECIGGESQAQDDQILSEIKAQSEFFDSSMKVILLVYSSSLVFIMQAGFAMICSGCVRKKNVQNTILKNLLDICGSSIAFFFVGYAFAYGGEDPNKKTFIGSSDFLLTGVANEDDTGMYYVFWWFQFSFAATAATIVAGTLAERCQMNAYLLYSMMLTGFVYPVIVHNIWSKSGFLSYQTAKPLFGIGMIDFAGSGVVHVTGGFTALVATMLLGPRKGRFYNERGEKLEKSKAISGHSKSLQMLGTFILWFGWYGFNAGSAIELDSPLQPMVIARAVVNTTLSGATAGVVGLLVNLFHSVRQTGDPIYKLSAAMNGCLTGLTAITGSCGVIEPWTAIVIGGVAGLLYLYSSSLLDRLCIDDAVDAIPVHLVGGTWGVIATGLFSSPKALTELFGYEPDHIGWFYSWGRGSGDFSLLGCQLIGLLFIYGWILGIMTPFFFTLNYMGMFRSDSLEEVVGLDVSYHGYNVHTLQGEVKEADLQEYYRKTKRYEFVEPAGDENDVDVGNVDRFE